MQSKVHNYALNLDDHSLAEVAGGDAPFLPWAPYESMEFGDSAEHFGDARNEYAVRTSLVGTNRYFELVRSPTNELARIELSPDLRLTQIFDWHPSESRVAFACNRVADFGRRNILAVIDPSRGTVDPMKDFGVTSTIADLKWSPDGRRLAILVATAIEDRGPIATLLKHSGHPRRTHTVRLLVFEGGEYCEVEVTTRAPDGSGTIAWEAMR